jgi:hypothetical protein
VRSSTPSFVWFRGKQLAASYLAAAARGAAVG